MNNEETPQKIHLVFTCGFLETPPVPGLISWHLRHVSLVAMNSVPWQTRACSLEKWNGKVPKEKVSPEKLDVSLFECSPFSTVSRELWIWERIGFERIVNMDRRPLKHDAKITRQKGFEMFEIAPRTFLEPLLFEALSACGRGHQWEIACQLIQQMQYRSIQPVPRPASGWPGLHSRKFYKNSGHLESIHCKNCMF